MDSRKKELLQELAKNFEETKKDLGFKSAFSELDEAFFITDAVLSADFVSERFSRQICGRIVDTYMNWNHYLNNLLMPNPAYMVSSTESRLFNTEEWKKKIWELIKGSMKIATTNYLIGLNKDKKMESKLIDEAFEYWTAQFKPALIEITGKINHEWKK